MRQVFWAVLTRLDLLGQASFTFNKKPSEINLRVFLWSRRDLYCPCTVLVFNIL